MKNKAVLTLVAALVLGAGVAQAEDYLSPRARENRTRIVPATSNDVRQAFEFRGGKAAYAGHSVVSGGRAERDLVREQRGVLYTGKNAGQQRTFEIAPVK